MNTIIKHRYHLSFDALEDWQEATVAISKAFFITDSRLPVDEPYYTITVHQKSYDQLNEVDLGILMKLTKDYRGVYQGVSRQTMK